MIKSQKKQAVNQTVTDSTMERSVVSRSSSYVTGKEIKHALKRDASARHVDKTKRGNSREKLRAAGMYESERVPSVTMYPKSLVDETMVSYMTELTCLIPCL
jgi:hypothetical protein